MRQGSTLFLRGVVVTLGLLVLAICLFVLPVGIVNEDTGEYRPILLGLYVSAIPFFLALYQSLKVLSLIDKNRAFSESSITALRYIKYCANTISAMFALGMPYIFYAADKDDAPGVILIAGAIIAASFVIGTFAAVLQRLVSNAVELKEENDLTV